MEGSRTGQGGQKKSEEQRARRSWATRVVASLATLCFLPLRSDFLAQLQSCYRSTPQLVLPTSLLTYS